MPASDAGKISCQLLKRYGVRQAGFEYVESFLFCIKYIKASPNFYFQSFEEFISGKQKEEVISVGNENSSPFDQYWYNKVIEAESIIEKAPESLKKFYELWYYNEIDDLNRIFAYNSRYVYKKRDINRIEICTLVERGTLIVPYKAYFVKSKRLSRPMSSVKP